MAKNTIADLDKTPANNVDVLGQSTSGASQSVNKLDDMLRNTLALLARFYGDLGGLGTVGGSANAVTLTSLSTYQALDDGLIVAVKFASSPTSSTVTLNVDGQGAKAIVLPGGGLPPVGSIVANGRYVLIYDLASTSWVLHSANAVAAAQVAGSVNLAMAVTADAVGHTLTIAIKGIDGNDPSASNPVFVSIRNPTLTNGLPSTYAITSALSLVISSGSTLGFTSGVPGRLWVVLFDDAGTLRIGVVNCLNGTNLSILAIENGTNRASSTAEGGSGGADSSQTFYTGTAVTSKSYIIVGSLDWTTALSTAGAWDTGPNIVAVYRDGMKLPGVARQQRSSVSFSDVTGTTTLPDDDTIPQNTEGVQMLTMTITPNACNVLVIDHVGNYAQSNTTDTYVTAALFQDSTANALAAAWGGRVAAAGAKAQVRLKHRMLAGTGSSTTFAIRAGSASAGTIEMNGKASGRLYGGVTESSLEITEITA